MSIAGSKQSLEVDLQTRAAYGPWTASSPAENNTFSAGETTFATANGTTNYLGVPIVEDGFTMSPTAQRAGENLKRNIASQAPPNLTGFEISGNVNVLATPFDKSTSHSVAAWLLGAAINKESEVLRSYGMRWRTPNISYQQFQGCKVQTLTVEASEDSGIMSFTSEWVGASMAEFDGAAELALGAPTFPTIGQQVTSGGSTGQGWTFSRAIIYKAVQASAEAATVMIPIGTARSTTFTINNNLVPKAQRVKTILDPTNSDCTKNTFIVTGLREGTQEISGTFVIDYIDESEWTNLQNDAVLVMGIGARHPQSQVFGATAITAASSSWSVMNGSNHDVTIDQTAGTYCSLAYAAGDFLLQDEAPFMIENQDPGNVTTNAVPTDVSVLDFQQDIGIWSADSGAADAINAGLKYDYWPTFNTDLTSSDVGDYVIYDTAMGLRISGVKLDSANLTGGPGDILGQELQFTAGQFGSEASAITWAVY